MIKPAVEVCPLHRTGKEELFFFKVRVEISQFYNQPAMYDESDRESGRPPAQF